MVVVVAPEAVEAAIGSLAREGVTAWRVGEVVAAGRAGGRRYAEGSLR
jgi:phosphoribosylaminoimidazole (AIR) synthetase